VLPACCTALYAMSIAGVCVCVCVCVCGCVVCVICQQATNRGHNQKCVRAHQKHVRVHKGGKERHRRRGFNIHTCNPPLSLPHTLFLSPPITHTPVSQKMTILSPPHTHTNQFLQSRRLEPFYFLEILKDPYNHWSVSPE